MFAIIEGGDGTGKSSLAEALAERIRHRHPDDQVELLHRGPPERPVMDEYAFDVDPYRPASGLHIVADRWHLGTLVYAKLYRDTGDYGELGVDGFRWVELFLRTRGALMWHIDHPTENVRERLRVRGEDYLKDEDLAWCLDRFREVKKWSVICQGTIDTTSAPLHDIVIDMAAALRDAEAAQKRFNPFPGYVGGSAAHTLLVGEKHGGQPPHKSEGAFIPTGSNSSSYLLSSLSDPFWRGIGLVNAYETNVRDLLEVFDVPPHVVALGRKASENLTDLGVEHAAVPHPQFARRFTHGKKAEYGALIERIAGTDEKKFS